MAVDNPHEYDDDDFANATGRVDSAVAALWESGASLPEMMESLSNAMSNALDENVTVECAVMPKRKHVGGGPKPKRGQ